MSLLLRNCILMLDFTGQWSLSTYTVKVWCRLEWRLIYRLWIVTLLFSKHFWWGFPAGSDGKDSTCGSGDSGFYPWVRNRPWRRKWQPTPVFLPEKPHGQRSLVGYSPWGWQKSRTQLSDYYFFFFFFYWRLAWWLRNLGSLETLPLWGVNLWTQGSYLTSLSVCPSGSPPIPGPQNLWEEGSPGHVWRSC